MTRRSKWLDLYHRFIYLFASSFPVQFIRSRIAIIKNYDSIRGSSVIRRPNENGWTIIRSPKGMVALDPAGKPWRITGPAVYRKGNPCNAIRVRRYSHDQT